METDHRTARTVAIGAQDLSDYYRAFVKELVQDDIEAMNDYMNEVVQGVFSSFDTGRRTSNKSQPERFNHGSCWGC